MLRARAAILFDCDDNAVVLYERCLSNLNRFFRRNINVLNRPRRAHV